MRRYEAETLSPELYPEIGYEEERRYLHSTQSGALLPFVQSLITAVSLAGAVLAIAWLLKRADYYKFAIATFAVILPVSWLWMLGRWSRLTAPLEKITGWDINGDGKIGEPETLKVELKHDKNHIEYLYLPYPERLPEFARQTISGVPISEAAYCGADGLFSRSEFVHLRDALIKSNIAAWRSPEYPARGVTLTASGRSVIKYIAGATHPGGDNA